MMLTRGYRSLTAAQHFTEALASWQALLAISKPQGPVRRFVSAVVVGGFVTVTSFEPQRAFASPPIVQDANSSTSVNCSNSSQCIITGGIQPGNGTSLYHSFSTFNIPAGWSAIFSGNNTSSAGVVERIFARVLTGSSTLDGPLLINGYSKNPELFLVNPNGFILGTGFSTNVPSLSLMAADNILLKNLSNRDTNEYFSFGANTPAVNTSSLIAWGDAFFAGIQNSNLQSKSIEIYSSNLSLYRLNLSGSTIDFKPGSVVNIKSLNVYAVPFVGAVAEKSFSSQDNQPISPSNLQFGTANIDNLGIATFASNSSVLYSGGSAPESNLLLNRDSLYIPTSTSSLSYGSVRFDGAINPFNSSQAIIGVIAKSAYIGSRQVVGGLTSPFGLNAGVASASAISYGGLYYGFGAAILIDPAIYPDRYLPSTTLQSLRIVDSQLTPANLLVSRDTALTEQASSPTEETVAVSDDIQSSSGGESNQAAAGGGEGSEQGGTTGSGSDAVSASPPSTTTVSSSEASSNFSAAEQASAEQTAAALGVPLAQTLTPQQAQGALRQALANVRNLPQGQGRGGSGPQSSLLNDSSLIAAAQGSKAVGLLPQQFNRAAYNPAILQVRFTEAKGRTTSADSDAFLDLTFIPAEGEIVGKRVEVSTTAFAGLLKQLYSQLSRQDDLRTSNPASPSRRLYDYLIAPLAQELDSQKVTTLLIGAERGLQGVPYAALHSGTTFVGERFAFSLTPSLSLTNLTPGKAGESRLLAAGASQFDGLAPLPLVPQELYAIAATQPSDEVLNASFTPATIEKTAADPRYDRIHLATHAEFLPGGASQSKLYSGTGPVPLVSLSNLRKQRQGVPIDLIAFSACRTALGDPDSELGFAGLALQAGARSAIGTLWYVDDVATSAYFIQAYRYLQQGIPKAEALQFTRRDFASGRVQLSGDQILGADGQVLLTGLTTAQQRRVADGLSNPYFWAGIELLGAPW